MGKKKIALFYDTDTESGKQVMDFLTPFAKRKSDIVGELILLWIAEHGPNVPVQWLDRRKGEPGAVKPCFPKSALSSEHDAQDAIKRKDREDSMSQDVDDVRKQEDKAEPDAALIKAGLASFL
ncbi:MAG: hypothetical protein SPG09_10740 [Lachnospiraceae bacterium]|nr:hypothetical protein [bacterium]MDY5518069.1 hypothetical protein [Lachnospiraceae bacterium]